LAESLLAFRYDLRDEAAPGHLPTMQFRPWELHLSHHLSFQNLSSSSSGFHTVGDGGGIYPQHEFDMGDIPPSTWSFFGNFLVLKI
jgi:hypothetical protein